MIDFLMMMSQIVAGLPWLHIHTSPQSLRHEDCNADGLNNLISGSSGLQGIVYVESNTPVTTYGNGLDNFL